jgi:hypothetical protein
MNCTILTLVNVAAVMSRDMITCNPTKTNYNSEKYNIWIWKLELNL